MECRVEGVGRDAGWNGAAIARSSFAILRRPFLLGCFAFACLVAFGRNARAESSAPNLSAGDLHTCARTSGLLWCWGSNSNGELGDGTTTDRLAPEPVRGLARSVAEVSSGAGYTCARMSTNSLWCWGADLLGQLGNGTTTGTSTPVNVGSLGTLVAEVSAGNRHTCAREVDGSLWCFGDNGFGALGTGNTTVNFSATPVQPFFFTPAITAGISAGDEFTLSVGSDGTLYSWGGNFNGELGSGMASSPSYTPLTVGIPGATAFQVSAGDAHSCVRTTTNALWCFGLNSNGALGNGTTTDSATPVQVPISNVMQVTAGGLHTCALKTDGTLWCWGRNSSGQIGDGTTTDRLTPVQVTALGNSVAEVSAGEAHTCARKLDNTFWCWGDNSRGQIGDGTTTGRLTPTQLQLLFTCGDGQCVRPETLANCRADCAPPVPIPATAAGLLAALLAGIGLVRSTRRSHRSGNGGSQR